MLSDPEKKKLYDQFGHAAFDGTCRGQWRLTEYMDTVNRVAAPIAITDPNGSFHEYHFEGGDMD